MTELRIPLGPFANRDIIGDEDAYGEIVLEPCGAHGWRVSTAEVAHIGFVHEVQRDHRSDHRRAYLAIMGTRLLGAFEHRWEAANAVMLAYFG
jgi:hypothetical protein